MLFAADVDKPGLSLPAALRKSVGGVSILADVGRRVVEPLKEPDAMQFLMLIRIENTADYETNKPLPAELHEAMGELMSEWSKTGAFVSAAGLKPTSLASRVRLEGGKVMFTDGPFAESKEVIGGFFLLEAADRGAALEMT